MNKNMIKNICQFVVYIKLHFISTLDHYTQSTKTNYLAVLYSNIQTGQAGEIIAINGVFKCSIVLQETHLTQRKCD